MSIAAGVVLAGFDVGAAVWQTVLRRFLANRLKPRIATKVLPHPIVRTHHHAIVSSLQIQVMTHRVTTVSLRGGFFVGMIESHERSAARSRDSISPEFPS